MIDIRDGELLDMLPSSLKDVDMQCLSYALKISIQKLLDYEIGAMTSNFIDQVPEEVLDVLAVELRSLYYLDSMDIETKRAIIKNTLIWHTKAGTPSAVAEMIETIFGAGSLVEWYDFEDGEGEPGTFDISTSAQLTPDILEQMETIIERVKNIRSHLRWVSIDRTIAGTEYAAIAGKTSPKIPVTNNPQVADREAVNMEYAGTAAVSFPEIIIVSGGSTADAVGVSGIQRAAAAAMASPTIVI